MINTWRDASTYSSGERGIVEPRIWKYQTSVQSLEVVVHRKHQLEGGFLSCHAITIKDFPLPVTDLEAAKTEAIRYVQAWLSRAFKALP